MAKHRHKRETNARILPRFKFTAPPVPRAALVAAPVAMLATMSAVTLGVLTEQPTQARDMLADSTVDVRLQSREPAVSRSESRAAARAQRESAQVLEEAEATRVAVRRAETTLWTTEELNVWSASTADAAKRGVVDAGEKVLVTGRQRNGRQEIVVRGESRWVTADYLDDEKPVAGIGGACTNGSSVPSGADPNIGKVHQAVCAAFPEITAYGVFRGDGEHGQGRAVDIMVSGARGWQVAEFVRANRVALGVEYLIYSQKIWSVERGGEGWRGMSDRGSATANHYDHVHVTVY